MSVAPEAERREWIDRVTGLARGPFAGRAAHYDATAAYPVEDFEDLYRAGLHAPAVPRAHGGLGLGLDSGLESLWRITTELARADMALARCWEGHVNSQILLTHLGTESQKGRWFPGIVGRGERWVAWSGEPQTRIPGQSSSIGTRVREVEGGYVVEGRKAFATGATGADWAILLVNLHGPGGARHASADGADGLLLLACDLTDPAVRVDPSWWDPIGMRGTASHAVEFDRLFLPAENRIGAPGQYLREHWQTCFSPHYGATFLGGAEAAYDYALRSIRTQGKEADPFVQQRVASMALNIESSRLWLGHVASLWQSGRLDEARAAGNRARYLLERWATEAVDHAVRACGARSLIRPSPLERILRDLSFYVRHDNADHVLATIGRHELGLARDDSFFHPTGPPLSPSDVPPAPPTE